MSNNIKNYIQHLQDMDLTEREAKIYITLLSNELCKAVEMPESTIYTVLKKMNKRGICAERFLNGNKFYEAVNPNVVFKKVLDKYDSKYNIEFEKKKKVMEGLNQTFSRKFQLNQNIINTSDSIEILKDDNSVQKKYIEEMNNCRQEVLMFIMEPYLASSNSSYLNEQEKAEINFLKRGGVVHSLYKLNELQNYDFLKKSIKHCKKNGEQVKIAESLPMKMVIFDSEKVMFPLLTKVISFLPFTTVVIEHSQLALTCKSLFEDIWEKEIDYDEFFKESTQDKEKHEITLQWS